MYEKKTAAEGRRFKYNGFMENIVGLEIEWCMDGILRSGVDDKKPIHDAEAESLEWY